MKIKSKYLGKTFGKWTCTRVDLDYVQGARAKWAGHRNYCYTMERKTSDDKANKIIRLNHVEAAQVYSGKITVEAILDKRERKGETSTARRVQYHFYKR